MSDLYYSYRPALQGLFAKRFYKHIGEADDRAFDPDHLLETAKKEIRWATHTAKVNPQQRCIYRAAWAFLADLIRVGWRPRWHTSRLELAEPSLNVHPHEPEEVQQTKDQIRLAMSAARIARIHEAREFIERMESPPQGGIARVPVVQLIADPHELAADLENAAATADTDNLWSALASVIKPYLQLVEEGDRCEHTGHKLSDIWRYFRFTWRTAAETTPGRTLLYLIRDASRKYHPIVGIASIENSPLRITCRDAALGWTPSAVADEILRSSSIGAKRRVFSDLLASIDEAVEAIDTRGLCTPKEQQNPHNAVLIKLASIVASSIADRDRHLRQWRDGDQEEEDKSELGNISKQAEDALYQRKRAEQLGRLLTAKMTLGEFLRADDFEARCDTFLSTDAGRSAIHQALIAIKNRFIGTSMMELNVCGAIPPYNEMLAGKLVALLMLSPQVVEDYRKRYGKRASDIASRMKNKDVIRPADLVFLGTTSLFRVGASQYNRLKIPAGLLGDGSAEVRWQRIGETKGYGTWHISRNTLQSFNEVLRIGGFYEVNHVFGEGASPKLRAIRKALDVVFERGERDATEAFARHTMSRLVFGAWLATNGPAVFRGKAKRPTFYFGKARDSGTAVGAIVGHWLSRWVAPRLGGPGTITSRMRAFDRRSLLVSQLLTGDATEPFIEIMGINEMASSETAGGTERASGGVEFVQGLYRGASAYADGTKLGDLQSLHVATPLDAALCRCVQEGKSIILTGNPGDGKTHLLRILEPKLAKLAVKPEILLDASALSNEVVIQKWRKADKDGRPVCIAINAAVLKELADRWGDFAPVREAQRQVENAVVCDEEEAETQSSVVAFDLSRRNVLSREVVSAVIDKLTNPAFLQLPDDKVVQESDARRNIAILSDTLFRERFQAILDRVSRRGYHATLREVQAVVAFLIFGGRPLAQVIRESGDWQVALPQLIYQGRGRLFQEMASTFDPYKVSHPLWDDDLLMARTASTDWAREWHSEVESIQAENLDRFKARKRAFFFLHTQGDALLRIARDIETEFARFLGMPPREGLRHVFAGINAFFSRSDELGEYLRVWQCHRFAHIPRRVLYSDHEMHRRDFDIVDPRLTASMGQGFTMPHDHRIVRLRHSPRISLRVDFPLYRVLAQSLRGFPSLYLDETVTRRLWQFMEKLDQGQNHRIDECDILLLDTTTGQSLKVTVDNAAHKYVHIE